MIRTPAAEQGLLVDGPTRDIATLTAPSLKHVEPIVDAHCLKRDSSLGVTAIRKSDPHEAGTKIPN